MKRVLAGALYLGATLFWALLMVWTQAWRCDDSCLGPQSVREWRDNPDAWQYGVVGWLGAAGLGLAILAICLSFARRWTGIAALTAHAAVFTANCLILYLGRTIYGSFVPFVLMASIAAAAGFIAVGGLRRQVGTA